MDSVLAIRKGLTGTDAPSTDGKADNGAGGLNVSEISGSKGGATATTVDIEVDAKDA